MRCNKIEKNPCKICYKTVTKKTGLQCQGACRTWAHFKCLNYTPGKIQDIKSKVIKVMCPCPNCETDEPKEVLTNPPFSCTNSLCPANLPPSCESGECPNKYKPIPSYEYDSDSCPDCPLPKLPPAPTSGKTAVQCCSSQTSSLSDESQCPQECKRRGCPSDCSSKHESIVPNQSLSYSNFQKKTVPAEHQEKIRPVASDSQVTGSNSVDQKLLRSALQNLCNTVCDLSTQLKDIIVKLDTNNKQ